MAEEVVLMAINRSGWPSGPWDAEPEDRVEFVHFGFACMMLRSRIGSWCGYVGVPEEHQAYGKPYDDVDVDVHGGLTYAAACEGEICHAPAPGMPDRVWWLGFDCAHFNDVAPRMLKYRGHLRYEPSSMGESYRTLGYVRRETERLAEQLKALMV